MKLAQSKASRDSNTVERGERKVRAIRADPKVVRATHELARRKVTFESLPPHLQQIVRGMAELGGFMEEEEFTHAQVLAAQGEAGILIEDISLNDLVLLIAFYRSGSDELQGGWELMDAPLYRRWGELDPEGVALYAAENVSRSLEKLTEPVLLADPFSIFEFDIYDINEMFGGAARVDPIAALKRWEAIAELLEGNEFVRDASFAHGEIHEAIFKVWSGQAPLKAWDYLKDNSATLETGAGKGFARGLADDAPWQQLAAEFRENPEVVHAASFAAEWARRDPENALNWIREDSSAETFDFFYEWHSADYSEQALGWLQENGNSLPVAEKYEALRVGLAVHEQAGLYDLLERLPHTDATWEFVEDLAGASIYGLGDDAVRSLAQSLEAPDEIRTRVEAALARRNLDPFAE